MVSYFGIVLVTVNQNRGACVAEANLGDFMMHK